MQKGWEAFIHAGLRGSLIFKPLINCISKRYYRFAETLLSVRQYANTLWISLFEPLILRTANTLWICGQVPPEDSIGHQFGNRTFVGDGAR